MTTPTGDESQTISTELLRDLARRHFGVETLDTRNSDSLDFHDVAVWSIRAALEEAWQAGRAAR
jgi:hypothetical protein